MRKAFYRYILLFLVSVVCSKKAGAQFSSDDEITDIAKHWELGITVGANNFLGDLGGTLGKGAGGAKDYVFKTLKPLVGISAEYYKSAWVGFRIGLNYTDVNGADSLITNEGGYERWRWYRNLSFNSHILEGYVLADIYPVMLFDKTSEIHQISPFINVGIGMFHFNPRTKLNGQWVDLAPLHLEGQGFKEYATRKPYKLTQFYIPLNIGVKYYFSDKVALSAGFQFRHTFTDYIDDISTTYIDPSLFDIYLSPDKALLAKQLYSRSLRPEKVKPDILKADPSNKDSYVTFFLTLHFRFERYMPFYYGGQ